MAKNKAQKDVAGEPTASARPEENYSTFSLCKLIKILNRKKLFTLKWLQKIGMLNRETACDNCGRPMTLVHRQNCTGSRADKYEWECGKCRMCTKSLRSGTVFQSSKLSLQKITILMYFWAHDFPPHVAQRELSITERTVNKWYLLCQEACMDALIRNTSKLGGEGRNLEVVEGKLGKRAVDSYRTPAEHPVIGVIDVDTGSCFLQVVIGNTKATLLTLLKERIANGSTLHSKCWMVRDCLSDEKFCKVVKNHKLTLSNEDRHTFQKLHDKVCKSVDKVSTSVSFDPVLCATIYKNAMKHEDFFFVKFLGELGTLYRDGIRYEMMNQLEHSEPGPSTQQRPTVNTSEKMEWTSTVGTHCHRCRSKQYSNSEVQATESDEITICDVDEPQNVSVSKQNVRKSTNLSEGYSGASDDIIVLDDTCKPQNGITSEQTVPLSGDVRRKQNCACDDVTEVEQSDKCTNDGRSERTANTSCHISENDCAEVSEVFMLVKHAELPNSSAGEKAAESSRRSTKVESCTARGAVSPGRDCNPQNDGRAEVVVHVSGCDDVVDIAGDEPKEVSSDVDVKNDKQTEEVPNVGHIAEIDISMEEQIDVDGKVDEKETIEIGVDEGNVRTCEQEDVRGDVDVTGGGDLDSEMAAHGRHDEEREIIVYEERDAHEGAEMRPEENGVPVKLILMAEICEEVAADDVEDIANECTVKDNKTNGSPGRKRNENCDVVNIDEGVDNTNECTVKEGETNAKPGGKGDADSVAKESTVKGSKTSASPGRKSGAGSDLVNIGSAVNGGKISAEESTARGSKTSATDDRKREAASELVNIDSAEDDADECAAKRSKTGETASKKEDVVCDLVDIDNTECTVKHSRITVGKKRDSASDLVNMGVADDNANECPVKRSKMTPNIESERETGSALVSIDDDEDNGNEQKDVLSKTNATAKRKSDAVSDIVNIVDLEDTSNERKDVLGKTNGTAGRKSGVLSDVVNIDEVEDNAGDREGCLESANRTGQKEFPTISDVIDIDEVDSDVEVIETAGPSVPDVMVVAEQRRKVQQKDEPRRHERRLLIDNVPCKMQKSVLKAYFANFGHIESLKILPIPSRRSLRYAVLVFNKKQVVDTIQATRPHVLESGVKLVTFRGSSPDIDNSLNTRLNKRMIVKVQKNNMNLTTEDVQQYFSEYGQIYDIEKVTLTGMECGSSTFVVGFEDYDSADVACLNSPHTIKGVENVTCEKVEDDDLLLSGTKMDPICIENDSDVEEVQVDAVKTEPSTPPKQSQEEKGPGELPTSSGQSGGEKRPSDETPVIKRKRVRRRKTFNSNDCTPQNTTVADLTAVANGRFALPTVPGSSGHGGQSVTHSWHTHGRPPNRQLPQRPVQAATPAPPTAGGVRAAAAGASPAMMSAQTVAKVGALLAVAVRQFGNFRNPAAHVQTHLPQAQAQVQTQAQAQMQVQMQAQMQRTPFQAQTPRAPFQAQTPRAPFQAQTPRAPFQAQTPRAPFQAQTPRAPFQAQTPRAPFQAQTPRTPFQAQTPRAPFQVQTPQWRRPPPAHFQPQWAYSWTPAKQEPPPSARPAVPHRVLTGVPITRAGFSGPSHVTRTRPALPAPGSANARTFIPRATGSQGSRF